MKCACLVNARTELYAVCWREFCRSLQGLPTPDISTPGMENGRYEARCSRLVASAFFRMRSSDFTLRK